MDTEFEVLDETCDSLKIIESALLVCHILPIILVFVLPFTITQLIPWIPLYIDFVISIIISWLTYCIISVKFLIKAMIYSEDRNTLYEDAVRKKLLIKEGFFSRIFFISTGNKNELNKLLSNPLYKKDSVEFKVRTSLTYIIFLLFASIFTILYGQSLETKAHKIKYWATIVFAFFGLIYSLYKLFHRHTLLTLLPQGIQLPEQNIITFDKIKDFKIIKKDPDRSSTKYITFQHLSKNTYLHEEIDFDDCNISVKKLNYHYYLNMKNYKGTRN